MTDREKLIGLLETHCSVIGEENCKAAKGEKCSTKDCANCLADHLIAHGVTVREMQKPMDLVDAIEADDPVWIEHSLTFMDMEVIKIYTIDCLNRHFFADGTLIGKRINEKSILLKKDDYGKTWRCWAEKPRSEERKAAEWEEQT